MRVPELRHLGLAVGDRLLLAGLLGLLLLLAFGHWRLLDWSLEAGEFVAGWLV